MTEKATIALRLRVNGLEHTLDVPVQAVLADVLREDLNLSGTKVACDAGACGACTVLVDARPVTSCSIFAFAVDGLDIVTIEGLAAGADMGVVQTAFHLSGVPQCGFCTPGMVLLTHAFFLAKARGENVDPTEWISANICRCSGYGVFRRAFALLEGRQV